MNPERIEELAALKAVGALEGHDLEAFEEYFAKAGDVEQAKLADFNNVAGLLAASCLPSHRPSPELKEKIMGYARASRPQAKEVPPSAKLPPKAPPSAFSFIRSDEGTWQSLPVEGVRAKELATNPDCGYTLMLMDLDPHTEYPEHHHTGAEECFVLSGDLHVEGHVLHAGDFHHAEAGSDHGKSFTENGCRLLLVVEKEDY